MLSGIHLEGRKGIARYWQCESNSIRGGKKMSHVQDSLSLHSGCIAYLHRPALGWTVTDNTFPGLNTHWKCRRSLPLLACQLVSLVHSIQVTISRKDIGEPSLDWLLPSQESSTSWVKKCLRLWLTNCSSLPLILLSRMRKVYGITFLKLWENRSLWYRIPKTFAIFAVDN